MSFIPDFADPEQILIPEGERTSNSTRVMQPLLEGSSYFLRRGGRYSRVLFRITAQAGGPTVKLLFYQRIINRMVGGVMGNAVSLIASVSAFPIGAVSNFIAKFAQGSVDFYPGIVFVLFGRDSAGGTATIRTQVTTNVDLFNSNNDLNTHPCTFTTALASNAANPATIDPRLSPTGQLIQSPLDLGAVLRLLA